MYYSSYSIQDQMIAWENKPDANQVGMAIMKTYSTKIYREHLQYSKASKGTTRFNEAANQSYKKLPLPSNEEDQTVIMFAQAEKHHQEQME